MMRIGDEVTLSPEILEKAAAGKLDMRDRANLGLLGESDSFQVKDVRKDPDGDVYLAVEGCNVWIPDYFFHYSCSAAA